MGTLINLDAFRQSATPVENPRDVAADLGIVTELQGQFGDKKNDKAVSGVFFTEMSGLFPFGERWHDLKADDVVIGYDDGSYTQISFADAAERLTARDNDALTSFSALACDRAAAIEYEMEASRPQTISFAKSPEQGPKAG